MPNLVFKIKFNQIYEHRLMSEQEMKLSLSPASGKSLSGLQQFQGETSLTVTSALLLPDPRVAGQQRPSTFDRPSGPELQKPW